jgi:hypothetical protein
MSCCELVVVTSGNYAYKKKGSKIRRMKEKVKHLSNPGKE